MKPLALLIVAAWATVACRDSGFASIVMNDSREAVIVTYEPSESDIESMTFRVPPSSVGLGLGGGSFEPWHGGRILVYAIDCRLLGEVQLDSTTASVRVETDLTVTSPAPEEVPSVGSQQFPADPGCDSPPT